MLQSAFGAREKALSLWAKRKLIGWKNLRLQQIFYEKFSSFHDVESTKSTNINAKQLRSMNQIFLFRIIWISVLILFGSIAPMLQMQKYSGDLHLSPNEFRMFEVSSLFCKGLKLFSPSSYITVDLYDRSVLPEGLSMMEYTETWDIEPINFRVTNIWLVDQSTVSIKCNSKWGINLLVLKGVEAYADFTKRLDVNHSGAVHRYFSMDNTILDEVFTIPENGRDSYFFVFFNHNKDTLSDVSMSIEVYQPSFPQEKSLGSCVLLGRSNCKLTLASDKLLQVAVQGPSLNEGEQWHQFGLSYRGIPRITTYLSIYGSFVGLLLLAWGWLEYFSGARGYARLYPIVIKKLPPLLP